MVKNLPAIADDMGSIPGLGRSPGERNGTPVFLTGKYHGQKMLAGDSSWSHKESNLTRDQTTTKFYLKWVEMLKYSHFNMPYIVTIGLHLPQIKLSCFMLQSLSYRSWSP